MSIANLEKSALGLPNLDPTIRAPMTNLAKHGYRQVTTKILVSVAIAVVCGVAGAAPASAASNHHSVQGFSNRHSVQAASNDHSVQGFLGAVRAVGITGTDPAMLEDGYNVCWELWKQHSPANQVAAGMQKDYPTLTTDQAAHFVIAAYQDLCPVPGAYDYWAYSTS
jgi:hypothetical protein